MVAIVKIIVLVAATTRVAAKVVATKYTSCRASHRTDNTHRSVARSARNIAKWSHFGPLAMSELELGSLVVQRCLCCLLGMCVFLVV